MSEGHAAAKPNRKIGSPANGGGAAIAPESVRAQLTKIVASQGFLRAEGLGRLLRFTVEETLEGRGEHLKEYLLGVEVFGRGDSFDPRIDPIVRVQARKLRARLADYYQGQGRKDTIIIEFPKGRYVPLFGELKPPSWRKFAGRRTLLLTVVAVMALLAILTALPGRPQKRRAEGVMHQLTWDTGLTTQPAIARNGTLLAYASDRSGEGNLDIWVQPGTSGQAVRLTRDSANDYEPDVSPDGSQVAFRSDRNGGGVYTVPARGGPEKLIAAEGHHPRFSPDGRWIAYDVFRGGGEVYVVPSEGGHPKQIHHFAAFYPMWTPDGQHILFTGNETAKEDADWWVASLDDSAPVRTGMLQIVTRSGLLPPQQRYYFVAGDWDPQGHRIVFSARTGDSENLWEISISPKTWKTTGEPERLSTGASIADQPSLSPAGELVFSDSSLRTEIWSLPVDANRGIVTGVANRVVRDNSYKSGPYVSLAGRRLAFVSNRSGNGDIWLKDLETGVETVLASTASREYRPILSADESKVAYYSFDNPEGAIYIRPAGGGAPETVCNACFSLNDWSADGVYMLYQLPVRPLGLALLDVRSRRKTEFLKHPHYDLGGGRFSHDGRWICFVVSISDTRSRVFAAPFRGSEAPPEQEWVPVTGDEASYEKPRWSPDDNLLYFLSDRDGYLCIWARRLEPGTKHPIGNPFEVYHSGTERRSVRKLGLTGIDMAVSQDRLIFNSGERTGNVWMTRIR
jgi:Tol biopolymer transport system component